MLSESEDIVRELERRRKRRERLRRRQEEVGAGRGRAGPDGCGSGAASEPPRAGAAGAAAAGRGFALRVAASAELLLRGEFCGTTDGTAFPGVPPSLGTAPCCAGPRLISLHRPCFFQLPTSSEMRLVL